LPPLRERREDIPALAEAVLARLHAGKRPGCHLDKSALKRLRDYDFPGNVRELRNVLQRALVYCQGQTITAADLRFEGDIGPTPVVAVAPPAGPGRTLKTLEEDYVRDLLARHHGHRRTVADLLGVSERTLYRKLKQYNLG
jgi:two-component system response regulator AtoC